MRLLHEPDEAETAAPRHPPCAACKASGEAVVWEHWLCYPCIAKWMETAPVSGNIAPPRAPLEEICAAYLAWTKSWVAA